MLEPESRLAGLAPEGQRDFYSVQTAQAPGPFLLSNLLRDFSRKETKRNLGVGTQNRTTV